MAACSSSPLPNLPRLSCPISYKYIVISSCLLNLQLRLLCFKPWLQLSLRLDSSKAALNPVSSQDSTLRSASCSQCSALLVGWLNETGGPHTDSCIIQLGRWCPAQKTDWSLQGDIVTSSVTRCVWGATGNRTFTLFHTLFSTIRCASKTAKTNGYRQHPFWHQQRLYR